MDAEQLLKRILRNLYVDKKYSHKRIAGLLDVDKSHINEHIIKFGLIEERTDWSENKTRVQEELDKDMLKRMYIDEGLSREKIASVFSVSTSTISNYLKDMGLCRTSLNDYDSTENMLNTMYHDKDMTQQEIADALNISPHTVYRNLKKYGLNTKYSYKEVDEDYFEEMDSSEKAYWLGFIVGDGNIGKTGEGGTGYSLTVSLNAKDTDHLLKLRNAMSSSHSIHESGKDGFALSITRKKIVEDLEKYGVVPCKSHKTYMPDIPEKYHRHFIRGLFDADGSISGNSFTICGSRQLMQDVNEIIGTIINSKNDIYKHPSKENYVVHYGKQTDKRNIYEYLYDDAQTYLERKKRQFEKSLDT